MHANLEQQVPILVMRNNKMGHRINKMWTLINKVGHRNVKLVVTYQQVGFKKQQNGSRILYHHKWWPSQICLVFAFGYIAENQAEQIVLDIIGVKERFATSPSLNDFVESTWKVRQC